MQKENARRENFKYKQENKIGGKKNEEIINGNKGRGSSSKKKKKKEGRPTRTKTRAQAKPLKVHMHFLEKQSSACLSGVGRASRRRPISAALSCGIQTARWKTPQPMETSTSGTRPTPRVAGGRGRVGSVCRNWREWCNRDQRKICKHEKQKKTLRALGEDETSEEYTRSKRMFRNWQAPVHPYPKTLCSNCWSTLSQNLSLQIQREL